MCACVLCIQAKLKCQSEVGLSDVWSYTILKTQYKNQNKSILESGIPLQKAFKADKIQCIIH